MTTKIHVSKFDLHAAYAAAEKRNEGIVAEHKLPITGEYLTNIHASGYDVDDDGLMLLFNRRLLISQIRNAIDEIIIYEDGDDKAVKNAYEQGKAAAYFDMLAMLGEG